MSNFDNKLRFNMFLDWYITLDNLTVDNCIKKQ